VHRGPALGKHASTSVQLWFDPLVQSLDLVAVADVVGVRHFPEIMFTAVDVHAAHRVRNDLVYCGSHRDRDVVVPRAVRS
jgi:hypothetical protein